MAEFVKLKNPVTTLPRGGYLVQSPEGYIQFGSPPETIKDTMTLPESVPQIFVLPRKLFNWQKGINLSDLEFPIYYNYFIKKKKTTIICTRGQASRLMLALQEALFGPKELHLSQDIHSSRRGISPPNLRNELNYYRGKMRFRDVLSLNLFKNNRFSLGEVTIAINGNNDFDVFFGRKKAVCVPGSIEYKARYDIGQRLPEPYRPPLFGITCLGPSHGFDPGSNTSGFIIWLNHSGIMIDPPINSTEWLEASNVNPKLIDSIILTHCHADHDAGTLQKILEEGKVTVYTTKTVMRSFLKKYSSLTSEPVSYLVRLFDFRPIYIGNSIFINGGEFRFFYTLHSIPTIGFTLKFQNQSFVYSSDHQADPVVQKELLANKVITRERYEELSNFPWESKVVYHESGMPPLHTPVDYLDTLPEKLKKKTVVYHIAKKDFPKDTSLRLATFGIENTLYFKTKAPSYEIAYLVLGVLKHLDFIDSLPMEKAQEFVSIIEAEKFSKGEMIIKKGTPGNKFYIIYSGNVLITDEQLIGKKILGAYEYFGEIALLTGKPRTADVKAETDVRAYTIEKDKFLSFIYGTDFEKTLRRLVANRNSETWNILVSSPFSQFMTSYQKTWLESILVPRELKGRGTLVQAGKPFAEIYIIRRGLVKVSKQGRKVAALRRGDIIGDMQRVQLDKPADFTVTYNRSLSLFAVSKTDAVDFIEGNPGLAMKLSYDF
ncbi:hypothetical protein ES705_09298 [subsurface metagenome]